MSLMDRVINCCDLSFLELTLKHKATIKEIINNEDIISIRKANDLCEIFGIEKRGNKNKIYEILKINY